MTHAKWDGVKAVYEVSIVATTELATGDTLEVTTGSGSITWTATGDTTLGALLSTAGTDVTSGYKAAYSSGKLTLTEESVNSGAGVPTCEETISGTTSPLTVDPKVSPAGPEDPVVGATDVVTGGEGSDLFKIGVLTAAQAFTDNIKESVEITDFTKGDDTIQIENLTVNKYTTLADASSNLSSFLNEADHKIDGTTFMAVGGVVGNDSYVLVGDATGTGITALVKVTGVDDVNDLTITDWV